MVFSIERPSSENDLSLRIKHDCKYCGIPYAADDLNYFILLHDFDNYKIQSEFGDFHFEIQSLNGSSER